MVAVLRRAGQGRLTRAERALLYPMITRSDNAAAVTLWNQFGADRLRRVAAAAGMRRFAIGAHLFEASIDASDQARFFLVIDRLVPAAHRAYARRLPASIVSWQRWGIARRPSATTSAPASRAAGVPASPTRSRCCSATATASRSPCSPRTSRRWTTARRRSSRSPTGCSDTRCRYHASAASERMSCGVHVASSYWSRGAKGRGQPPEMPMNAAHAVPRASPETPVIGGFVPLLRAAVSPRDSPRTRAAGSRGSCTRCPRLSAHDRSLERKVPALAGVGRRCPPVPRKPSLTWHLLQ
jgi:Beta-lactamase enzyme family